MKQLFVIIFSVISSLMLLASCTNSDKQDVQIACSAVYIFPKLNFQVVSKANNTDLFFAPVPAYDVSAIKVYLKNGYNKIDSLLPVVTVMGTQKYFTFSVMQSRLKDTCFVKIKGLKVDTLIYTLGKTNAPCPQWYINSVAINRGAASALAENGVLQIKK